MNTQLPPKPSGKKLAERLVLLATLPHLSPAEATAFADDVAAAREELARAEVRDPWES